MTTQAWPALDAISSEAQRIQKQENRTEALRYAMSAIEPFLQAPTNDMRVHLYKTLFSQLGAINYQKQDFESVDYQLYELAPGLPMFRGPPVPRRVLKRGEYFCVIGAAQTFGRLSPRPWPQIVSERLGLPVLNLGRGGAARTSFCIRRC